MTINILQNGRCEQIGLPILIPGYLKLSVFTTLKCNVKWLF